MQGLKIAIVRLYLRLPQAAGQVKILIFLVFFFPYMPIISAMLGKCLFSDILRPDIATNVLICDLLDKFLTKDIRKLVMWRTAVYYSTHTSIVIIMETVLKC